MTYPGSPVNGIDLVNQNSAGKIILVIQAKLGIVLADLDASAGDDLQRLFTGSRISFHLKLTGYAGNIVPLSPQRGADHSLDLPINVLQITAEIVYPCADGHHVAVQIVDG